MAQIVSGESNLTVHYKLSFPNGERYTFFTQPVSPEQGRSVYGSINENYSFIGMTFPLAKPFPFLQGIQPELSFLAEKTGLAPKPATLLRAIMSPLTLVSPADVILEAAEVWYKGNR